MLGSSAADQALSSRLMSEGSSSAQERREGEHGEEDRFSAEKRIPLGSDCARRLAPCCGTKGAAKWMNVFLIMLQSCSGSSSSEEAPLSLKDSSSSSAEDSISEKLPLSRKGESPKSDIELAA